MSRDLGLNHGPGKGDNDRTDNRTEYEKNLEAIRGFNPSDRTGYVQYKPNRWRKVYGNTPKPQPPQCSDS